MHDRLWKLAPHDGAYRLEQATRPTPEPGPGQLLVRVHAVSLNYRDLINLRNIAGRPVADRVPTSDGAGEVVAVGPDVTDWQPGDRVIGCFFQSWSGGRFQMRHHQQDLGGTIDGMLAEHVVLNADAVVACPDHLHWREAATLPCAALTAWSALFTRGNLQVGATALVLGTGGVSIFALQLASTAGARVIVTSSQDAKLERARALGAWETVNYRSHPDWEQIVWQLTEKRGVDHVIEVGGPGTLEKSLACVAPGGQIALIGVLTGFGAPAGSLFPLVSKNARMDGIYVGSRDDFQQMNQFLVDHHLRPVIDRVFPFDHAPAAYDFLESGEHFGKVVIDVAE